MASRRKVTANRRNARRSTGPRTAEGKAVSSANAVRHGILSRSPVIEDVESQAEWQEHLDATLSGIEPVGYLEQTLARRIALQTWRLERLRRHDTALSRERITSIGSEELGTLADSFVASIDGFVDATRDRDAFEAITKMKPYESVPAPLAIRILKRVAEVNGLELDEARLPGEGGDLARDDSEVARWSAPEVVRFANEIGERGGTRPDTALLLSVNSSTYGWEARAARLREVREQRLMLEGAQLEVLQRYESGLERSLYRTLHEIERLQAHRNGGDVPVPAVLDVTVEAGPTSV